jgi:hypothetical protein
LGFYKNNGSTFEPWHYLVTNHEECETVFGVPYDNTFIPATTKSVLCRRYGQAALETNENVSMFFYSSNTLSLVNIWGNTHSTPYLLAKQNFYFVLFFYSRSQLNCKEAEGGLWATMEN